MDDKKYPCTYDVFLETSTGRLWRLEEEKVCAGYVMTRLRDIKTEDVRSPSDLDMLDVDLEMAFKLVGNFPHCDMETLELLYGQRQSRWNY